MKKTVLFVLLDQYAEWEAAYLASALHMLAGADYEVKTVAPTREPVRSIGGFRTLPDYDFDSAPSDYCALILIGGMRWRTEAARRVRPLAEDCLRKGALLGAICDASAWLGSTGALNHVRHTSNTLDDLKGFAGANYTGEALYVREQAVRGGNIVTANGTAALEFAREVLLALEAAPERAVIEWYNFHKLGYYQAPLPGAL